MPDPSTAARRRLSRLPVLLLLLGCAAASQATVDPSVAERPPVTPIRASKIILVGDSTTAVQGGWGPSFCADHVASFLACVNLARGGRSTYNYRAEGSWDIALHEMRGDAYAGGVYVLIQFGHNDQPGKPGRSTDLATEFPENLRRYVREVRAAGAVPVLLTPLTRRQFKDGVLIDDLAPWADATRKVAAELDVPLVDLHARSVAAVQGMGPVQAMRFAQARPLPAQVTAAQAGTTIGAPPPMTVDAVAKPTPTRAVAQDNAAVEPMGTPKAAFDYTHLGREGADFFAATVADELARQVPALRRNLIP
ncbi:rhamnogalacturonan acetylesterase [Pseudoxanthomonas daejeonensis]|uniref:rhamnogalacturonan acetylesterase n=1 Tax=Pseudoxanthomonas daejeonensis TaxID=266062 RepID=UPI001F545836|nr:rhamnogalacturonan acetylesterase [Pseudoxanthomonas daejeonensis]UNK58726.1 rhamnogalacturonan acetylesterase [Pseudoxanthomonas daejeonensis]